MACGSICLTSLLASTTRGGDGGGCRQLVQRTSLLNTALDNTARIRDLSIIGAKTTLYELERRREDQELVMQYLKRQLAESSVEVVTAAEVEQTATRAHLHVKIVERRLLQKVEKFQNDTTSIGEKLLQQNAKISLVLEEPVDDFKSLRVASKLYDSKNLHNRLDAASKLIAYETADFVRLSKNRNPSLGIKYTIEALRVLVDPDYAPSEQ